MAKSVNVHLTWLQANQCYVFTFGDALLRMIPPNEEACPLYFSVKEDAIKAAEKCGLKVWHDNIVSPID